MTVFRRKLARNNKLVRFVALLLAVHYLLPIQLVWCNEDDSTPRSELAFNGQCLAGSASGCCHDGQPAAAAAGVAVVPDAAFSESHAHSHCLGCSDELIHPQPSASMGQGLRQITGDTLGGCLFSFSQPGQLGQTHFVNLLWQKYNCQKPGQQSLYALATCLVI